MDVKRWLLSTFCVFFCFQFDQAFANYSENKVGIKTSELKTSGEKKWDFRYKMYHSTPMSDARGDNIKAYGFFRMRFSLDEKSKWGIRQQLNYDTIPGNSDPKHDKGDRFGDTSLTYHLNHGTFLGSISLSTEYRVWFPTSEYSQASGQRRLQMLLYYSSVLANDWRLWGYSTPSYYFFVNNPNVEGLIALRIYHFGAIYKSYHAKWLNPAFIYAVDQKFKYKSLENHSFYNDDGAGIGVSLLLRPIDNVSLFFPQITQYRMFRSNEPFKFLSRDQLVYWLTLQVDI